MTAPIAALLEALPKARQVRPGAWVASCPAHEDRSPSLAWKTNGTGIGLKCHAGCATEAVVAALGATMADLFEPKATNGHAAGVRILPAIVATTSYEIRDVDGAPQAIHERRDRADGTKAFTWRRPDGQVGLGGRPEKSLPLYRTETLAVADPTVPAIVTEGEKAADSLASIWPGPVVAVAIGAPKVPDAAVFEPLRGRPVVLWPDNDAKGRELMAGVAGVLAGVARTVVVLDVPDLPDKGDAADYVAAGRGSAELLRLLEVAAFFEGSGLLSPAPDAPPERKQSVTFRSAREVAAEAPDSPPWVAWPIAVSGALTEVNGRTKAAGKTTLLMHAAATVLDGLPFLGRPTLRTPIVYLSEQPPASLRQALDQAGLSDREDLRILLWRDARTVPWRELVAAAVDECDRVGAKLLIVDTLAQWAGVRGDSENDAGAALEAIEPLQAAAAGGLAVIVARHERKSGGDVADSGRGSSALTGAVDIVIRLSRKPEQRETIRSLSCLSRFGDTPDELLVDLGPDGYVVLGTEAAVAFGEARNAILAVLLRDVEGDGVTEPAIAEAIGGRATTTGQALRHLLDAGDVERTGAGRKGSPYRYRRVAVSLALDDDDSSSIVSPALREGAVRESNRAPALSPVAGMSVGDEMATIFGVES